MANGGKRSVRLLVAFFVVLAIATFFSRAIYAALLPQVRVAKVTAGSLSLTVGTDVYGVRSDIEVKLRLPQAVSGASLIAEGPLVKAGKSFKAGDELLRLSAYECERAIEQAERAVAVALREEQEWRYEFQLEIERLQKEIDGLLRSGDEEAVRERQRELAHIKGIERHGGAYLSDLESATAEALALRDGLYAIRDAGFRVLAPENGVMLKWYAQKDSSLSGGAVIGAYAPEGASLSLFANVSLRWQEAGMHVKPSVRMVGGNTVPWEYQGMERDENGAISLLIAPMTGGTLSLDGIESIEFTIQSPYCQSILPGDALDGEGVYVLRARKGSWRQTEYYVELVDVSPFAVGDERIAVRGEIAAGDQVVVFSSKPVFDGDTVYLLG